MPVTHPSPDTIEIGGIDLCVQTFGAPDDTPILLIAGAASSMDAWDEAFCRRLADARRFVVRYDHRDTGQSTTCPVGEPAYTVADLDADPLRLLDALGVPAAHVVGVSMGGGIGQSLAAAHPHRVLGITLISTSPAGRRANPSPLPDPTPELTATFEAPPSPPTTGDAGAMVEFLVEQGRPYAGSAGFDEDAARRAARRTVGRAIDPLAAGNHFVALGGGDDPDGGFAMADIAVPTLVVHGTEDPLFPIEHGRSLGAEIDSARLIELPGGGHEHPPPWSWDVVVPAITEHTS